MSDCYSGCETGDVGRGTEESDEPSEQHWGEDRQVSLMFNPLLVGYWVFLKKNSILWKPLGRSN